MEKVELGRIIEGEAERDAIHVAVAPVVAATKLRPGEEIGLVEQGSDRVIGKGAAMYLGIVDPFLIRDVEVGEKCWMFLFPNTITSLRHEWEHPGMPTPEYKVALDALTDKAFSEKWLREYAKQMNCYDEPDVGFARLLSGLRSRELHAHGRDLHYMDDVRNNEELKRHAETYLGITIDWDRFTFSCSC